MPKQTKCSSWIFVSSCQAGFCSAGVFLLTGWKNASGFLAAGCWLVAAILVWWIDGQSNARLGLVYCEFFVLTASDKCQWMSFGRGRKLVFHVAAILSLLMTEKKSFTLDSQQQGWARLLLCSIVALGCCRFFHGRGVVFFLLVWRWVVGWLCIGKAKCWNWTGFFGEAVLLLSKAKLVYFGIVDKVWTAKSISKVRAFLSLDRKIKMQVAGSVERVRFCSVGFS